MDKTSKTSHPEVAPKFKKEHERIRSSILEFSPSPQEALAAAGLGSNTSDMALWQTLEGLYHDDTAVLADPSRQQPGAARSSTQRNPPQKTIVVKLPPDGAE